MKTKESNLPVSDEYLNHEYRTNRVVAIFLFLAFVITGIVNSLLLHIDSLEGISKMNDRVFLIVNSAILVIVFIAKINKYRKPWIKYMLLGGAIMVCTISFFLFTTYTLYLVFIPIFISTRYFNKRIIVGVSIITGSLFTVACLLNVKLEKTSEAIRIFHQGSSYNSWHNLLDAVIYVMLPCFLVMGFLSIFAVNMTVNGRKLISEKIESHKKIASVDAELSMAAQIQKSVLPEKCFKSADGNFKLFAYESPAKEVCGDFYDYFMINDNVLAVVVADVSDKGMPAAMFMMSAKKALQCALISRDNLSEAIELANKLICSDNECEMFLTMWLGLIDTRTGVGKYVNAGHPFPIIRHGDGSVEFIENSPDLFLGNFPEETPKVNTFRMMQGDTLLVYTDGLTDSTNELGQCFGIEKVINCIKDISVSDENLGLHIVEKVKDFSKNTVQFDDITLLCLHCNNANKSKKIFLNVQSGIEGTAKISYETLQKLKDVKCNDDKRRNVGVAIDEICTNIAQYAYSKGGNIQYCAEIGDNYIIMEFTDSGSPFNPLEQEDPSFEEVQIGGLGIYFVKALSDYAEYEYSEGKNKLKVLFVWNM